MGSRRQAHAVAVAASLVVSGAVRVAVGVAIYFVVDVVVGGAVCGGAAVSVAVGGCFVLQFVSNLKIQKKPKSGALNRSLSAEWFAL